MLVSTRLLFEEGSSRRLSSLWEGDARFLEIGDMGAMVAKVVVVDAVVAINFKKRARFFPCSTAPSDKSWSCDSLGRFGLVAEPERLMQGVEAGGSRAVASKHPIRPHLIRELS